MFEGGAHCFDHPVSPRRRPPETARRGVPNMKSSSKVSRGLIVALTLLLAVSSTLVLQASPAAAVPAGQPAQLTISKQWVGDAAGTQSTVEVLRQGFVTPLLSVLFDTDGTSELDLLATLAVTAGELLVINEFVAGVPGAQAQVLVCSEPGTDTVTYVMPSSSSDSRSLTYRVPSGTGSGEIDCVLGDSPALPNPDLTDSCGIDVVLVLDESNSINTANGIANVEDAARAFVAGLVGTGSRMRIVEFGTDARDATVGGDTGFQTVDSSLAAEVETYLTNPSGPDLSLAYDPQSSGTSGFTNWEAAIDRAVNGAGPGSLIVFVTDGEPNTTTAT